MKKLIFILSSFIVLLFYSNSFAQKPGGKNLGFGILAGDPTGLTVKYWSAPENAWVFDIGSSYFGSPRIGVDYLWHFNAFNSRLVNLYAGPGGVLGLGEGHGFLYKNGDGFYNRTGTGFGVRGVFGVNFLPERTPLEIFVELGVLVGIAPDFGSAVDGAIGIRFYP